MFTHAYTQRAEARLPEVRRVRVRVGVGKVAVGVGVTVVVRGCGTSEGRFGSARQRYNEHHAVRGDCTSERRCGGNIQTSSKGFYK